MSTTYLGQIGKASVRSGAIRSDATNLPMSVEDVTAEWLGAALSTRWPGTVVTSLDLGWVIHGSATKIQLRPTYAANDDGKPETVMLKIGFEPFSSALARIYYSTEAIAYSDLLPTYEVNAPECYYQAVQTDPPQVVLLLEDLGRRNVTFGSALRPISVQQTAQGLSTIASFHARSWNKIDPASTALSLAMSWGVKVFLDDAAANADALFHALRGYAVPVALHDASRLQKGLQAYTKLVQSGPTCFLHGDTHVGNTFTEPDGQVGFIDWQTASYGHWCQDVTYFVTSALDTPDRRRSEKALLGHYLSELARHGVEPPLFDEAWLDYRRSVFYGFLMWLGNPDEMQPPEVNLACFARSGAAMLDLDGYGAMGL